MTVSGTPHALLYPPALMFAGKNSNQKSRPEAADATQHLPSVPQIDFPVAAVDVGSNTVKVLLRKGDGAIEMKRYDVYLGESVGKTGRIEPEYEEKLDDVFDEVARYLFTENNVREQNIIAVATAALREAENGPELVTKIRRLGIPLETIDGLQEAELMYASTLAGTGIKPRQKAIVLEIGGGSTELAYGKGSEKFQRDLSSVTSVGTSRLQIEDAFDAKQQKKTRRDIREALRASVSPEQISQAQGRKLYIKNYWYFKPMVKNGKSTRKTLKTFLKPNGLRQLAEVLNNGSMRLDNLAIKLLIMDETMRLLGKDEIRVGADGGLKFALLGKKLRELA